MRLAVYTLGCRLNFAETEELIDFWDKKGLKLSFKDPELIIIRGCSVTKKAEKETGAKIKECRKKEKNSFIIASGCLRKDFSCSAADIVLSKEKEKRLIGEIKKLLKKNLILEEKKLIKLRTRSFLKIQDGCEKYCSYCLIPYLRGKEKSRPSEEIIEKIKEKKKMGYQEIVLTGANIRNWKGKSKDLVWLIKEILKRTKIPRIRISSLWPNSLNNKLVKIFANHRFCQHIHLSLQSLSDSVLKKMGRNSSLREIKNKIKEIRKSFPDLTLTADIIVGFPGETDNEFNETYKNLKEVKLAKIHVFRYSIREGTAAAKFQNQVEEKIKKRRAEILLSLSKKLEKNWREKFLGKIKEILFEQKKNGFWQGLTDNYLRVFVKSEKNLNNQILPVKLVKLHQDGIIGKL